MPAGYDYGVKLRTTPAGLSPASTAASFAAPPVRLSTAVSCTCLWSAASPPSCPVSGSGHVTPRFPPAGPDGHGSPPSAVLSGRYDFLLRASFGLLVRQPAPQVPAHSCPPLRSRRPAGPTTGRDLYCSRWPSPLQRPYPRAKAGSPRFPGSPSCNSAPVHDPGRPVTPRRSRRFRCCPQIDHTEGVVIATLEAHCDASSPAVYASRRALPHAMQDSLPAGGLHLCRAGVEPAGQRRKVSDQLILLPRTSPGARSKLHAEQHFRSPTGIWSQTTPIYYQEFLASEDARIEAWRRKLLVDRDIVDATPNRGPRAVANQAGPNRQGLKRDHPEH